MKNESPYSGIAEYQIWKKAVASINALDIRNLWQPKFPISHQDSFATYGSCFAQNFSLSLRERGLNWVNAEPAPNIMSAENARQYGYGIYSSRTQNIYTSTMLLQWLELGLKTKQFDEELWVANGRYYDPLRPTIEPQGFESRDELLQARKVTAERFIQSIKDASVFVFTLGLTERWINSTTGMEYSLCPGTAAGNFDASIHAFDNLTFGNVRCALKESIARLKTINTELKVLITVSPVPLIATMQNKHVLTATTSAKSVLRAVADEITSSNVGVDYFPSYELISSFPMRGMFFEPNMRSVSPHGVRFVMEAFYSATNISDAKQAANKEDEFDTICEEELLAAFT